MSPSVERPSTVPPARLATPGSVKDGILDSAIIGRDSELRLLDEILERTSAGQACGLFIGGDAGIGKTRLLDEFLASAQAAGAAVALGHCLEVGSEELPFAPMVAALRRLRRTLGPAFETAAEGFEGRLGALLPDRSAGRSPRDPYSKARLFEHTITLIEKLAQDRTVVLALEDLHWSDRSTRELLAYLLRTLHDARVLLVATFRTDDLHRRHPLRPYLAEVERQQAVTRLDLAPFSRAQAEERIGQLLPARIPDLNVVDRIYERSQGNAFFVEELALSYRQLGSTGLTASLRDILMVRVEALPESAIRVVKTVAGGGRRTEHALLLAALDVPEDDLLEALHTAIEAHVLVADGESAAYRFRHALMQEAVLDDLLPGELSRINRAYAEALEADPSLVPADERIGRLASYWYHAHAPSRALPAMLAAGCEARRGNAFPEQLLMLERVLEMWDSVPQDVVRDLPAHRPGDDSYPAHTRPNRPRQDRLLRVDLLADATLAAARSGDHVLSSDFARTATDLLEEGDAPEYAAWFWLQRARATQFLRSSADRELTVARELVEERPPSKVQADVLARIALDGTLNEPSPAQLAVARRAADVARATGAKEVEALAGVAAGMLLTQLGQVDEGLALMRASADRARAAGLHQIHTWTCLNLAALHERVGRSAAAAEAGREGMRAARDHGLDRIYGGSFVWNLVTPLLSLGRLDEAEEVLNTSRHDPHDPAFEDNMVRLRAEVALLRDDVAGASRHLAPITGQIAYEGPQQQYVVHGAELLLRVAAREGRFADARSILLTALSDVFREKLEHVLWPLLVHAAAAEADGRGMPDLDPGRPSALERIRQTGKGLSQDVVLHEGWARMLAAESARAEGRDTPALWTKAVEVLRRTGQPHPLGTALFRSAAAHAAAGSRKEAALLLREAEEQARQRHDAYLSREIRSLAQRAGIALESAAAPDADPAGPVRTTDPMTGLGLTGREREVLELLTLGRTNRQIAAELFISVKTASLHVSHILAKLSVTNRGEAAAAAHRLRLFPADPVGNDG